MHPSFKIPEQDYQLLVGNGNWEITEIPLDQAKRLCSAFGLDESFCVFGSGLAPLPDEIESGLPIAGIDWIKEETNPKPGEPELNVYHFEVRMKEGAGGFPVYHFGKYETVAPHWSTLDDILVYVDQVNPPQEGSGS